MEEHALIKGCYPKLGDEQVVQLLAFEELLKSFNQKVNLVSRKESAFLLRHIIPSLLPFKLLSPPHDARVADIGTGGGLPGIPLAIAYPEMEFLLIDSTRKKLDAIDRMVDTLELKNVNTDHQRVEKANFKADLITGRAVTAFPRFAAWCRPHLGKCSKLEGDRGVLYWTGGQLGNELEQIKGEYKLFSLDDHLGFEEVASKKMIFLQA